MHYTLFSDPFTELSSLKVFLDPAEAATGRKFAKLWYSGPGAFRAKGLHTHNSALLEKAPSAQPGAPPGLARPPSHGRNSTCQQTLVGGCLSDAQYIRKFIRTPKRRPVHFLTGGVARQPFFAVFWQKKCQNARKHLFFEAF